jgi:predicted nucleic acid-binding protein
VKLVVDEPGSELAAELWDTPFGALSSMLCYPETRAALAAARRAKRLSSSAHNRACDDFEALHSELLLIGVDDRLVRHAGELAEECGLRGYDAVHLASALALGEDATLVTWDESLKRAASACGCLVAPAGPLSR